MTVIGCIEVCGAPRSFDIFNDLLIELSGAPGTDRNDKLTQIGKAKHLSIKYLKASRPPLVAAP